MSRFIEGEHRNQSILFPELLDDYITQDNPVRVIEAFIDELDLLELGFDRAQPKHTGRPAYHPGGRCQRKLKIRRIGASFLI